MLNVETDVKTKIRLSGRQNVNKYTVYRQNPASRNLGSGFPLIGSDVMLRHGLFHQNLLNTSQLAC